MLGNILAIIICLAVLGAGFYFMVYLPYEYKRKQMNEDTYTPPSEGFTNYARYKYKTFSRKY